MQLSLGFVDAQVIQEVSLGLWREVFEAIGWPPSLNRTTAGMTYEAIESAFHADALNDEQRQALETLHTLGTPKGRETIAAVLADRQIPANTLPQGLGECELALRLFLLQRNDGAMADVFSRAHVEAQEGEHRRYNDFMGKKPLSLKTIAEKLKLFEQRTLEHCKQCDFGDHITVRRIEDDGGIVRVQVMHSYHVSTRLAAVPGSSTARALIQYRPIHTDLLRYEASLGRLRITARAAVLVDFYKRIFGHVFCGDPTFFDGDPVCSLAVLQDRGRAALRHDVATIGTVRMTECRWERSDGNRLDMRNFDCFDTIDGLNLPIREGTIVQAKLKMELLGSTGRPVIVNVRVPSRIEIPPRYESIVNDVLASIGIRRPSPDRERANLWALSPWRHPIRDWRSLLGFEADALAQKGILRKTLLKAVESKEHPGAGRVLEAENVGRGEFVGISQMPEIPSQSLTATDLDGLELDIPAFQGCLRDLFRLTENVNPWSGGWLLDLGLLTIHDNYKFRLLYALREPPADAADLISRYSAGNPPVVLLPTGTPKSLGVMCVLLDGPIPRKRQVVRDIVVLGRLEALTPALCSAPDGARLIVDAVFGKIWVDEIEIAGLRPDTHPFRFVELMARSYPGVLLKSELIGKLCGADDDQTARAAKSDANRLIRAALGEQGKEFEDPFRPEKDRYRLLIPSHVRDAPNAS